MHTIQMHIILAQYKAQKLYTPNFGARKETEHFTSYWFIFYDLHWLIFDQETSLASYNQFLSCSCIQSLYSAKNPLYTS